MHTLKIVLFLLSGGSGHLVKRREQFHRKWVREVDIPKCTNLVGFRVWKLDYLRRKFPFVHSLPPVDKLVQVCTCAQYSCLLLVTLGLEGNRSEHASYDNSWGIIYTTSTFLGILA